MAIEGNWRLGLNTMPVGTGHLAAGLLALVLAVFVLTSLGEGQARQVRAHAQAQGDRAMAEAGFAWARLTIDDATAYVVGTAPDGDSRVAAMAAARVKLAPMLGWPGVFARLEDAMTVRTLQVTLPGNPDGATDIKGSVVNP